MTEPVSPTAEVVDGVLEQTEGDAVVLTLHAPERRNALSPEMRLRLRDRLKAALHAPETRAIVLTGAAGTFSAGGDVRQMAERPTPAVAHQRLQILHDIVRGIVGGPKPVLAAVEGQAFGAGLSLAAACDHVVAANGASFCAVFGRIGLVADCGLLWTLPQRVGWGAARDMLLTARVVDIDEAVALGLVDHVTPAGGALRAALDKVASYRAVGPLALAATKSALVRRPASLEDALAIEADLQAALRVSEDHRNACDAFLAKRTATMIGR